MFDATGHKLGGEFVVNANPAYYGDPVVVAKSGGGFAVLWSELSNQAPQERLQMFDAAGAKQGSEVVLAFGSGGTVFVDSAATLANDRIAVVSQGNGEVQILDNTGAQIGASLSLDNYYTGFGRAEVAALPNGGFVLAGLTGTTGNSNIAVQRFDSQGNKVGSQLEFSPPNLGITNFRVASLDTGGFVVAWANSGGATSVRTFDASGNFASGIVTGYTAGSTSSQVNVVGVKDGQFLLTWTAASHSGLTTSDIRGQVFDAAANKLGGEFQLSYDTDSPNTDHGYSDAALLTSGDVVTVWQGSGPGDLRTLGTTYQNWDHGIRGQILTLVTTPTPITTASRNSISEVSVQNAPVLKFDTTSAAVNATYSYQILADSSGAFGLDGDKLVLVNNALLDATNSPTVSLTIRSTDNGGNSIDEILNLTIRDDAIERRYSLGGESLVSTPGKSYEQADAHVAKLDTGGFVVTWTDNDAFADGTGSAVKAQLYDAVGAKVGSEFLVNTWGNSLQNQSAVTSLAGGGFVVVYSSAHNTSWIDGQIYTSTGAKVGAEFSIAPTNGSDQYTPEVIALANGGFAVGWSEQRTSGGGDTSGYGIRVKLFDATGAAIGADVAVNTITNANQTAPSIAALASSGFVMTWTDASGVGDTSSTGIKGQLFNASGAAIGGEFLVNTKTSGAQIASEVIRLGDGFVVSWQDGNTIKAQLFDSAGNKLGSEISAGSGLTPSLSALPGDGFMISWCGTGLTPLALGDSDLGIMARMFDSSGTAMGDPFLVNHVTSGGQIGPDLALLPNGAIATVWEDKSVDPSVGDIKLALVSPLQTPVFGTANDDLIHGAQASNFIYGGAGNDTITGGSGHDALFGQAGNDTLTGGPGGDYVSGGDGNDLIVVGSGDSSPGEVYDGGAGNDTLYFASGTDFSTSTIRSIETLAFVNNGSVKLTGAQLAGVSDLFVPSLPNTGVETVNLVTGGSISFTGTADTAVFNLAPVDTILDLSGMSGAVGATVNGDIGNDSVFGTALGDLLNGGAGADTLAGGAGNDFYYVDNVGDVVVERPNEGTADKIYSSVSYVLPANVEILSLTGSAAINGDGNDQDNILIGNGAKNALDGGAGADIMSGGDGNDFYRVDNAGDLTLEAANEGTDTVVASLTWQLDLNIENLVLTGTADINGIGNDLANVIVGNDGKNSIDGRAGADTMSGAKGDDIYFIDDVGDSVREVANEGFDSVVSPITYTLPANVERLWLSGHAAINGIGNALSNALIGNDAMNILDGGAGADAMAGGLGDDTYFVDDPMDVVVEHPGEGTDLIISSADYVMPANVENLGLLGTGQIVTGNSLDNVILGNALDNLIDGKEGADILRGYAGNDGYVVDNPGDVVLEAAGEGTADKVWIFTDNGLGQYTLSATAEVELLGGYNPSLAVALDLTANNFSQWVNGTEGVNHLYALGGNDKVTGWGGDDVLDGGAGNDTIDGGSGDDALVGGTGDDMLDGGTGSDTATFSGNRAQYVIQANGDGSIQVTGPDGSDKVSSVERFEFADTTFGFWATSDFDGDGRSDVLLRSASGAVSSWLTTSLGGLALNGASATSVGSGWHVAGIGDFDGDGRSDILWRNVDGTVSVRRTTANGSFASVTASVTNASSDWNVAGTGDFDGDGRSDILWRSDAGSVGVWQAKADGSFAPVAASFGGAGTDWHIAGTGDFDGDGRSDILWRSDAGMVGVWRTTANASFAPVAASFGGVGNDWQVAGTGDFTGDGRSDILWRSDTGTVGVWQANADGSFASVAASFTGAGTDWQVAGTGDYNGDGRSDILWHNDDGTMIEWLATSSGSFSPGAVSAAHIGTGAHVIANIEQAALPHAANDFDGDGRSDILWRNDNGTVGVWHTTANGSFTSVAASFAGAGADWHVAATGDFNGDGRSDILWRSDTGGVGTWQANADGSFAAVTASFSAAGTDWHVAGTGDFDGDGHSDILWRSDTGSVVVWQAEADGSFATVTTSFSAAGTDWHVAGIGDFNGDSSSDILWRNDDGTVGVWQTNGDGSFAPVAASFLGAGTDWHVAGTGDFDGDGRSDIVWRSDAGAVGVWHSNADGSFASVAASFGGAGTDWHVMGTGDFTDDGRSDILWRNDDGTVGVWQANADGSFASVAASFAGVGTDWHIAG